MTGALYWVEYRNGVAKRAPVPYDGSKPTSYPFGMASLESFPGVVAGAASCPQPDVINQ